MSFAQILNDLDARSQAKLERKLPSWSGLEIIVPASINLEQCSSESTALYKASLLPEGARVADLTGGLGADSWAFSLKAEALWFNERDPRLLDVVRCNFEVLGVNNVVFNGFDIIPWASDWQDSLASFAPDYIYLDPARRDSAGRKVFLLEDCSPDVVALMPKLLELAPTVLVKVSPMADLTMLRRRLEGCLAELHVVGTDSECKEVLCLCRRDASFDGVVLAEDGFVYGGRGSDGEDFDEVGPGMPFRHPKNKGIGCLQGTPFPPETDEVRPALLFVPSAAMVKSGLGPGISLMPFDEHLSHFGKFWQVVENLPFASSVIKDLGRRYPQAEVTARGVPLSSEQLRTKLRTKPGGPVHIFACTLSSQRRILVCEAFSRS